MNTLQISRGPKNTAVKRDELYKAEKEWGKRRLFHRRPRPWRRVVWLIAGGAIVTVFIVVV